MDFFSGIYDSLRGFGQDAKTFLNDGVSYIDNYGNTVYNKTGEDRILKGEDPQGSFLSKAARAGVEAVGATSKIPARKVSQDELIDMLSFNNRSQATPTKAIPSVNPNDLERQWLSRMQQFITYGQQGK